MPLKVNTGRVPFLRQGRPLLPVGSSQHSPGLGALPHYERLVPAGPGRRHICPLRGWNNIKSSPLSSHGLMAICGWLPCNIQKWEYSSVSWVSEGNPKIWAASPWTDQGNRKWKQTRRFIFLTCQLQTEFCLINHEMIHRGLCIIAKCSWLM